MFFYGVILCVGSLGALGYLAQVSGLLYGVLGATYANILVGVMSAIVDNIPVMFAVLSMNPELSASAMVIGDVNRWCWWIITFGRFCRRRSANGTSSWHILFHVTY